MLLGALATDEGSKSDVAVATAIVLTVDAECVKLFFIDAFAQVCLNLVALAIAFEQFYFALFLCLWSSGVIRPV
mgnify:CR=1 FL=1